jgi:hypothetical protein
MKIHSASLYTVVVKQGAIGSGWGGGTDQVVGSFFVVAMDSAQAKAMAEAWAFERDITPSNIETRKRPSAKTVYFPGV